MRSSRAVCREFVAGLKVPDFDGLTVGAVVQGAVLKQSSAHLACLGVPGRPNPCPLPFRSVSRPGPLSRRCAPQESLATTLLVLFWMRPTRRETPVPPSSPPGIHRIASRPDGYLPASPPRPSSPVWRWAPAKCMLIAIAAHTDPDLLSGAKRSLDLDTLPGQACAWSPRVHMSAAPSGPPLLATALGGG